MSSAGLSRWTQAVAFGIVAVAAVIGNISLMASASPSRSGSALPHVPAAVPGPNTDASAAENAAARLLSGDRLSGVGYSGFHSSASGIDAGAMAQLPSTTLVGYTEGEAGQVIPAIYAWDPDVRFVFYRHVSKWM